MARRTQGNCHLLREEIHVSKHLGHSLVGWAATEIPHEGSHGTADDFHLAGESTQVRDAVCLSVGAPDVQNGPPAFGLEHASDAQALRIPLLRQLLDQLRFAAIDLTAHEQHLIIDGCELLPNELPEVAHAEAVQLMSPVLLSARELFEAAPSRHLSLASKRRRHAIVVFADEIVLQLGGTARLLHIQGARVKPLEQGLGPLFLVMQALPQGFCDVALEATYGENAQLLRGLRHLRDEGLQRMVQHTQHVLLAASQHLERILGGRYLGQVPHLALQRLQNPADGANGFSPDAQIGNGRIVVDISRHRRGLQHVAPPLFTPCPWIQSSSLRSC